MVWRADDPQGNEAWKVRWDIVPYTRGFGYDLGCGPHKAYPHFIGVDNCKDSELFGIKITPDIHHSVEKLDNLASHHADFVFSSHTLEHIEDHRAALREWWRIVKVGGYLILYLPHKSFYPNIGTEGANPDHKHDFFPEHIVAIMETMADGWDLVENQERNQDSEYSFLQVYKKLGHKARLRGCDAPKPAKTCAVVRYGAFGDLMMASSIFPQLKAEGFHITLYTVPRGYDVVRHDPHIDSVVLQDTDQVPNAALGDFFDHLAKKYDRFVNLSESVEGAFLALPDRAPYKWSHEARHAYMNRNYLEFHHTLAGVPFVPGQKFYATKEEQAWAQKERQRAGGDYIVVWSLAGSSVQKHWPHMDEIIARMLVSRAGVRIILVGGPECEMLERGWENEPRVGRSAGRWSIRQSLAFLAQADMVIGPETGVLNAAAMMPMPKIVTLSHSSHENLTRDWINVTALEPKDTPCWPCHKMIYGFDQCAEGFMADPENPGQFVRVGALCQVNISPDQMWAAIKPHLLKREAA